MYGEPQRVQSDMCEVCGKRPKFVEGGFQHPYCGRTCAKRRPSNFAVCRLRQCPKAANTMFVGFCSEDHAKAAIRVGQVSACSKCNNLPATLGGNLCPACDRRLQLETAEPRLEELEPRDLSFQSVKKMVDREWKPVNSSVSVEKIFRVVNFRHTQRFELNRQKLASSGPVEKIRAFYSSQCTCNIGYLDTQLCNTLSCGICTVLKSSFKSFAFNISHDTGRHGHGIYSNLNSAQADQFATSCTSSPYRVMVLCDVTMERKTRLFSMRRVESKTDGESVFVTNPDSIIARHVILYTK